MDLASALQETDGLRMRLDAARQEVREVSALLSQRIREIGDAHGKRIRRKDGTQLTCVCRHDLWFFRVSGGKSEKIAKE